MYVNFLSLSCSIYFFLGYLDLISKIKCTFLGILRVLSGSSFDVPCFAFSSFVVQFSRSVLASALRDSLYTISHTSLFVNPFFRFFFKSFFLGLTLSGSSLLRSFYIISHCNSFVKYFFQFLVFFSFIQQISFSLSSFLILLSSLETLT